MMYYDITHDIITTKIKDIFKEKGYSFFENGDYNLNIIGVRGTNKIANNFDDVLLCIYKVDGNWKVQKWQITTDAGTHWLKNPLNKKGTALLVPNQYRGVYGIRKHNGQYDALCQTWGDVEVYRDDNKDKILDYKKETIMRGMFGINIHRSNPHTESNYVDKWSAGCQVFKRLLDFFEFMSICRESEKLYGNKFTYTLLNYKDLI